MLCHAALDHISKGSFFNVEPSFDWSRIVEKRSNVPITEIIAISEIRRSSYRASLVSLLNRFRNSQAQDPRDKVYSLLSLCSDYYRSNITPDYRPENTVACLMNLVACLAVQSRDSSDIRLLLYSADIQSATTFSSWKLPTWVPIWTVPETKSNISSWANSCSGSTDISVRLVDMSSSGNVAALHVKGAFVDTLERLCSVQISVDLDAKGFTSIQTNYAFLAFAHKMKAHASLGTGPKPSSPDSPPAHVDPVYNVMLCGLAIDGVAAPESELWRSFDRYRAWTRTGGPLHHNTSLDKHGEQAFQLFFGTARGCMRGRRAGVTRTQRLGAFPNAALKGDVIAVLQGFDVPFVLRRVRLSRKNGKRKRDDEAQPQTEQYRIVGTCYVHGIMDGELVQVEKQEANGGEAATERITVGGQPMREIVIV